jgi:hypothetical protein
MIANTKRKTVMISTVGDEFPKSLATQETGNVFTLYRDELEWLANFLTGNKNVAAACVIDAWAQAESEPPDFQQWPLEWARVALFVLQCRFNNNGLLNFRPHTWRARVFIAGMRRYRAA